MKKQKTIGYKIVKGFPSDVEHQVSRLLESGWEVKGKLFQIKAHSSRVVLLVQNMVLYKNG